MHATYVLSLFFCAFSFSFIAHTETTLFHNAEILTLDDARPEATTMVIENGRILFVGSTEEAAPYFKTAKTIIDLKQQRVLPGFIESHAHFFGIGLAKMELALQNTTSPTQVVELLSAALKSVPKGSWLQGRGWDQNKWPTKQFPSHEMLSKVSRDNPVILRRVDGHALWCNALAMKLAGVTKASKDPAGGRIVKDSAGNPTGVFVDNAMDLVTSRVPQTSDEQLLRAAALAQEEALRFGVTSLHDAGVGTQEIRVYEQLAQSKQLRVRINAMLAGDKPDLLKQYFASGPKIGRYDQNFTIRSIKLFADGALGSRGAALLAPYSDDPKNTGLITTSESKLIDIAKQALAHGFQVATHAIGDRANRIVLDAYHRAAGDPDRLRAARFRIEHAQIVAPADVARFGSLGVIASMQPTHCTSDSLWVPSRVGDAHAKERAYVWRSFLNAKVPLAFGSDAPVESLSPILGIFAAVTRKSSPTAAAFYPEQALTLHEALRAFTIGGAYAEFAENEKGMLKKGYLADFIVLDKDVLAVAPEELLTARVVNTFIGGVKVWELRASGK